MYSMYIYTYLYIRTMYTHRHIYIYMNFEIRLVFAKEHGFLMLESILNYKRDPYVDSFGFLNDPSMVAVQCVP